MQMPLDIPADIRAKIPEDLMNNIDSLFNGEKAPDFDDIVLLAFTTALAACINPTCSLTIEQKADIILAGITAFRSAVVLTTLKMTATGQGNRDFGLLLAKTPEADKEIATDVRLGIEAARYVLPAQIQRFQLLTEMLTTNKPAPQPHTEMMVGRPPQH